MTECSSGLLPHLTLSWILTQLVPLSIELPAEFVKTNVMFGLQKNFSISFQNAQILQNNTYFVRFFLGLIYKISQSWGLKERVWKVFERNLCLLSEFSRMWQKEKPKAILRNTGLLVYSPLHYLLSNYLQLLCQNALF